MIDTVYILSAPRSGSTLLDMLLGSHPDTLPVGELDQLPKNIALNSRCSCGEPIRTCTFWQPVIDRLSAELGTDLRRQPYKLDLGYHRAGVEIDRAHQTSAYLARRFLAMGWFEACDHARLSIAKSVLLAPFRHSLKHVMMVHRVLRELSGRRVIVDSSKSFRYAVSHYKLAPQTTRIVLLTRDGRGVLASHLRTGVSSAEAVRLWSRYYDRATGWIARNVDDRHAIRLRYEDLAADPVARLNELCTWLGLEPSFRPNQPWSHSSHIANGNGMRLGPLKDVKLDERWRTELTEPDLANFRLTGGAMNRSLGYVE